jgi:two-component system, cell cycle response regulator DivK
VPSCGSARNHRARRRLTTDSTDASYPDHLANEHDALAATRKAPGPEPLGSRRPSSTCAVRVGRGRWLPLLAGPNGAVRTDHEPGGLIMGARILIVQDEEQSLQLTSFLLEAFGHFPIEARTGQQGLDQARRQPVDLILLDLQSPEAGVLETVAAMRTVSERSSTPIVALTALGNASDGGDGPAAGFDGYISKAVTPAGFAAQIDAFLPVERRSSVRPRSAGRTGAA